MYWRRSRMKNAATSAMISASSASLPLLMDAPLREPRTLRDPAVVRRVRGRRLGPAGEEAPRPAVVIVVDAQQVDVHAGSLESAHPVEAAIRVARDAREEPE